MRSIVAKPILVTVNHNWSEKFIKPKCLLSCAVGLYLPNTVGTVNDNYGGNPHFKLNALCYDIIQLASTADKRPLQTFTMSSIKFCCRSCLVCLEDCGNKSHLSARWKLGERSYVSAISSHHLDYRRCSLFLYDKRMTIKFQSCDFSCFTVRSTVDFYSCILGTFICLVLV